MGDRGNIIIVDGDTAVVLYTHHAGSHLAEIARDGLAAGVTRWNDAPYLARIVFEGMTYGEDGTTGYGLSAWPAISDNEHPFLVIDVPSQRVGYVDDDDPMLADGPPRVLPGEGWSFDEIIAGAAA